MLVKKCCVPSCRVTSTNSKLQLYPLPASYHWQRSWLSAIFVKAAAIKKVVAKNKNARVCSRHFVNTDFCYVGTQKTLLRNAVPSVFNRDTKASKVNEMVSPEVVQQYKNLIWILNEHSYCAQREEHREKAQEVRCSNKSSRNNTIAVVEDDSHHSERRLSSPHFTETLPENNETAENIDTSFSSSKNLCNELTALSTSESTQEIQHNTADTHDTEIKILQSNSESINSDHVTASLININSTDEQLQNMIVTEAEGNSDTHNESENFTNSEQIAFTISNSNSYVENVPVSIKEEVVPDITESVYIKEEVTDALDLSQTELLGYCDCTIVDCSDIGNLNTESVDEVNKTSKSDPLSFITSKANCKKNTNKEQEKQRPPFKVTRKVMSSIKLPEICILCATANMSKLKYTTINNFSELIKNFSGVDILNSVTEPVACNICMKNLLEMCNFKEQIIAASQFITKKLSKVKNTKNSLKRKILTSTAKRTKKNCIKNDLISLQSNSKPCTPATKRSKVCQRDSKKSCKYNVTSKEAELKCSICKEKFSHKQALRRHEINHKLKRYKCSKCRKSCASKMCLRKHLNFHRIKVWHPCPCCGKFFPTMKQFFRHRVNQCSFRKKA